MNHEQQIGVVGSVLHFPLLDCKGQQSRPLEWGVGVWQLDMLMAATVCKGRR